MEKGRILIAGLALIELAGCATPATQVKVATMSVDAAYKAAQQTGELGELAKSYATVADPAYRPAPSVGIVTAPVVRMVYEKPWVDSDNNKHFGGWIAVPVQGYQWVMSDGAPIPFREDAVAADLPPSSDQAIKPGDLATVAE